MNSDTARNEKQQDLAQVMPSSSNGSDSNQSKSLRPWIIWWLPLITPKVGKRLLPADYCDILSRSPDGLVLLHSSMPKEKLYLHLCDNVLFIDNGTKSFTLDKPTGKKHFMLGARALSIAWSDLPKHWKSISRFHSVAELVGVCWLEIQGVINSKMMSPNTKYTFNLIFTVTSNFSWVNHSTEVSVGFCGQQCQKQFVDLDLDVDGVLRSMWTTNHMGEARVHSRTVEQRTGGDVHKEDNYGDVVVRLAKVESNQWKHGLVIEGIEIRAKME